MGTAKNCIDKALGDRDQNVDKLDKHLGKDIEELNREVKTLKQEAQVHLFCYTISCIQSVLDLIQSLFNKSY